MYCFYVLYAYHTTTSWRITKTDYNLDNAEDLMSWIIEKEKEVGYPILLYSWKRLNTTKEAM